jgi:SEC-C motif-containing protein
MEIEHFCGATEFDGMEIIEEEVFGDEAWVTFEVYLSQDGQDASFTERSCFRRFDGRWTYWDGELVN